MTNDVYVYMSEGDPKQVARTFNAAPCVNIDYDADGNVVGVEVYSAGRVHIDGKEV